MNSIIFVAGSYGVGKSTLCAKLSQVLSIPFYSAGDLISEQNGEIYGANKTVRDKERNQDYLIDAVNQKLKIMPSMILAGHFCIFNKFNSVEKLPEQVFRKLPIRYIVLLEADANQIVANLSHRDNKKYLPASIEELKKAERIQAYKIADLFNIPLFIYQMKFDDSDVDEILDMIRKG